MRMTMMSKLEKRKNEAARYPDKKSEESQHQQCTNEFTQNKEKTVCAQSDKPIHSVLDPYMVKKERHVMDPSPDPIYCTCRAAQDDAKDHKVRDATSRNSYAIWEPAIENICNSLGRSRIGITPIVFA